MLQIRKDYSTLSEVTGTWCLTDIAVRYLAENGHLRLSVRLFGVFGEYSLPEQSVFAEDDGAPTLVGERCIDGAVDLQKSQIDALFREGEIRLYQVDTEDGCALLLGDGAITVRLQDLVVREEERLRFETEELPRRLKPTKLPCFSMIEIDGRQYRFAPMPARVLQWFYERALTGDAWYSGKDVCEENGSAAFKLGDVFRRAPGWSKLIEMGSPGQYRFIPARARELSRRDTATE
jgi:hypothetical protein